MENSREMTAVSQTVQEILLKKHVHYSVHYGIVSRSIYIYYVVEWNCFLPEQMCIYQAFIYIFFWVQIWIFMLVGPKCSMLHFFVTKQTNKLYVKMVTTFENVTLVHAFSFARWRSVNLAPTSSVYTSLPRTVAQLRMNENRNTSTRHNKILVHIL